MDATEGSGFFRRKGEDFAVNGIVALIALIVGAAGGCIYGESTKQAQTVIKEADYVDTVVDRAEQSIKDANALLDRHREPNDEVKRQKQIMYIARDMIEDIESARSFATEYHALLEDKFKLLRDALATGDPLQVTDAIRELKVTFKGKAKQIDEAKHLRLRSLKMPSVPTERPSPSKSK